MRIIERVCFCKEIMRNILLYSIAVSSLICQGVKAENYAILVSAGKTYSDNNFQNTAYWTDLFLVYEYLLETEHYDSTNVYVFYGDGVDYNSNLYRYDKTPHGWGSITDYDNSYNTMYNVLSSLNNVITENDNLLFYWVSGHGGKNTSTNDDSYFAYVENTQTYISKQNLVNLVNCIENYNKRKIIWMTCYSGCMGAGSVNLKNDKTVILTSCSKDAECYSFYDGYGEHHSEFNFALFSLSTGHHPLGSDCIVTASCPEFVPDCDTILSMHELYTAISYFRYGNDITIYNLIQPCVFDQGSISDRIFIGEQHSLHDILFDDDSNYWLDDFALSEVEIDGANVFIEIDQECILEKNILVNCGSQLKIK